MELKLSDGWSSGYWVELKVSNGGCWVESGGWGQNPNLNQISRAVVEDGQLGIPVQSQSLESCWDARYIDI